MKLPIADSKIKTLFFYIFGIYFLFGVHFYSYTLGGYGLYLTNNIIGWILITLLISIGIKDKEEERIFEFKGNTEAGKKLIKCMKI